MDIAQGLSAASSALTIVKQLRDIDKSVDEASFKLAIAELTSALADTKIALSEARELIADKDKLIREKDSQIRAIVTGENCPICETGSLKTTKVTPHPELGVVGVQEKHLSCNNPDCNHMEKRMHDPIGLLDK